MAKYLEDRNIILAEKWSWQEDKEYEYVGDSGCWRVPVTYQSNSLAICERDRAEEKGAVGL